MAKVTQEKHKVNFGVRKKGKAIKRMNKHQKTKRVR
jgi:hypothetical protein